MAREDWQEREDQRRRMSPRDRYREDLGQTGYSDDHRDDARRRPGRYMEGRPDGEDFGQADYSTDYAYDPENRRGYRRHAVDDQEYAGRMNDGDYRPAEPSRSWVDRAGAFFSGDSGEPRRRRGPSDRVLWAVIVERLEDARLDLRDVEVIVEDAEVTLNGRVRHKADKRRIEDIADIDGVRHVQNNLRARDHSHWTFL
jgi:hypothetical protein